MSDDDTLFSLLFHASIPPTNLLVTAVFGFSWLPYDVYLKIVRAVNVTSRHFLVFILTTTSCCRFFNT
jgi:hypothetical protein